VEPVMRRWAWVAPVIAVLLGGAILWVTTSRSAAQRLVDAIGNGDQAVFAQFVSSEEPIEQWREEMLAVGWHPEVHVSFSRVSGHFEQVDRPVFSARVLTSTGDRFERYVIFLWLRPTPRGWVLANDGPLFFRLDDGLSELGN
jgi:hypothetical protein